MAPSPHFVVDFVAAILQGICGFIWRGCEHFIQHNEKLPCHDCRLGSDCQRGRHVLRLCLCLHRAFDVSLSARHSERSFMQFAFASCSRLTSPGEPTVHEQQIFFLICMLYLSACMSLHDAALLLLYLKDSRRRSSQRSKRSKFQEFFQLLVVYVRFLLFNCFALRLASSSLGSRKGPAECSRLSCNSTCPVEKRK